LQQQSLAQYEPTIYEADKFNSSINTDWQQESAITDFVSIAQLRVKSLNQTGYSLATHRNNLYSKMHKYQKSLQQPFNREVEVVLPTIKQSDYSEISRNIRNNNACASDRNFLLLNDKFVQLVSAISYKESTKPELGRILKDNGYKLKSKLAVLEHFKSK
jgi:hypothetical protein